LNFPCASVFLLIPSATGNRENDARPGQPDPCLKSWTKHRKPLLLRLIESLLDQTNPFAIITAAHLKTKATKNNPQERYTWKWTITRALYEKGFSTKDILALYRLVDWLMMLPDDLTKKFTQDLIAYEEEKKMPYITSAERIGIEKGRLEGRTEGLDLGRDEGMLFNAREMLLEALDEKFSSNTPADIKKQIQALNNKIMLKRLLRSTIQSKDIEEFRKTLEELTAQDPA